MSFVAAEIQQNCTGTGNYNSKATRQGIICGCLSKYQIESDFLATLCNCMLQKDQFFPYSCVLIINQSVQFSSYILCSYFCLEHSTVIIIQLQRENSPKSPLNQLGKVTLTLYKKIFEGKKISDFSFQHGTLINLPS